MLDFSGLAPRLDLPLKDLKDLHGRPLLTTTDVRIWYSDTSLEECLRDMYVRNVPLCLVREKDETVSCPKGEAGGDISSSVRAGIRVLDMKDVLHKLLEFRGHCSAGDITGTRCEAEKTPFQQTSPYPSHQPPLPSSFHSTRHSKSSFEPFLNLPVDQIADASGRNPLIHVPDTVTLRSLLRHFEQPHWILIYSKDSKDGLSDTLCGVFTLMNFMQVLERLTPPEVPLSSDGYTLAQRGGDPLSKAAHKSALMPFSGWTASMVKAATQAQAGSAQPNSDGLVVCYEDVSLFSALQLLDKSGYSALPIVTRGRPGDCRGVLSTRDLQCILLRNPECGYLGFAVLNVPVLDYLSSVRQLEALKARYPVIRVSNDSSLDTVLAKILASNIRRLILTNDAGQMTGILTVTDLGRFVARQFTNVEPTASNATVFPSTET